MTDPIWDTGSVTVASGFGRTGAGIDTMGCIGRDRIACVGAGLNGLATGLGYVSSRLIKGVDALFGVGGFGVDLYGARQLKLRRRMRQR